jgi:hypothetical protein
VLGVLLRHKAARNAGTLLMWALQRPQLIDMDQEPAGTPRGTPSARTLAGLLFLRSSSCVGVMAEAFTSANSVSSSSIGTYAAAMTQLEQSGAWHLSLHWACTGLRQLLPAQQTLVVSVWRHQNSQ